MKVGIVTQPLCANYGGILQNFALQQVLKKMGHEPITMDYMPSLSFGRYLLYAGKGVLCALSPSRRHPIKPYSHFLKRPSEIDLFVQDNISLTKTIPAYTKRVLEKYGIEAIIVGSDQVWRYSYNSHHLGDTFLDFAKDYSCRKIAYGASFGVEKWDYPDNETERVKPLARLFDSISVREDSGVILCQNELGVDAEIVLDPTLLLKASAYERFCPKPDPLEKPYLAAYVLDINDEKSAYIHSVAAEKGLGVKMMTVSGSGCSIEEWLSIIKNAEFVITDSYHGSLFSILFGKQFQTFVNEERGADRFVTLFRRLGIMDRLLYTVQGKSVPDDGIDYERVGTELTLLRKKSMSFLSSALQ